MTANQLYREYKKSGGTLTFAAWLSREKKKQFVNATGDQVIPENQPLKDSIAKTLDEMHRMAGYQDSLGSNYILGIHKYVWYGAGAIAGVAVGYLVYQKLKK